MAFPSQFLDELRARVGLVSTIAKHVKLVRKGNEHHGLCPFHKEKTPSFTVNEAKGFFHCFGCSAHGSVFDFVMEVEGVTFPEAVEKLALDAGMEIPRLNAADRSREARSRHLGEICEFATNYFQNVLRKPEGRIAVNYLNKRELKNETIQSFRLGFAPNMRDGFKKAAMSHGFEEEKLIEAGMIIRPDESWSQKSTYDRFRGRIIFPITNRRDNVIGFGGRIIDKGEPKYLNSPETPLFAKRQSLYGLSSAMRANRAGDKVLVVEGYMDVIALNQAGIKGAVAPLGTALTEQQLVELWRMSPEPIFCFDGDGAGSRAAARAALRALSVIRPGQGLLFAQLPKDQDPDSLIKDNGIEVFDRIINNSLPLSEVIWQIETKGIQPVTPETKARLQKKFTEHTNNIRDQNFRHYFMEYFQKRIHDGEDVSGYSFSYKKKNKSANTVPFERDNAKKLLQQVPNVRREQVLLATLINHPELINDVEEFVGRVKFSIHELDIIRQQVLKTLTEEEGLDSLALINHLKCCDQVEGLNEVLSNEVYTHAGFARIEKSTDEAREGWLDTYRLYNEEHLREQIKLTERALLDNPSSDVMNRLRALKEQQPV